MTDTATRCAPAFSLQQHATLAAWNRTGRTKLRATVRADHDDFEEVAEIGLTPRLARWTIYPAGHGGGGVVVGDLQGQTQWAVAGLKEALAAIELDQA